MSLISLDSQSSTFLSDQVVSGIQKLVDDYALRRGTRMPSIRKFAEDHGISRFTVVQAYDRLVAMGYLHSRPGAGFYVSPRPPASDHNQPQIKLERAMDVLWLLRNALQQTTAKPMPGSGWLPGDWMDESGIQRSLRNLSRKQGKFLTSYGNPAGYLPLRQIIQQRLADIGIMTDESHILLTQGATHGLDLIARYFISPGDTVLVDDPGYFILFGTLRSLGANIVGVPWNQQGPDTEALEAIINEHRPKLFFTNSVLHNPTGVSIHQSTAFRILQLAEKNNLIIVEDDVYGDFLPHKITRLATLDQLQRVIFLSSFSKTISASTRVGYIACRRELAEELTDVKLLSGLTTSEINERLIHQVLTDGYYRKHLQKLHGKLLQGFESALASIEKLGLQPYADYQGGMFFWVKMPEQINVVEMAGEAVKQNIMLAPGNLFRPHQQPSPYLRFNAAGCNDADTLAFIERYLKKFTD